MGKRTNAKLKHAKTPEQQATRLARQMSNVGFPKVQAGRGGFVVVDVANHSDADQRHMVRSGDKQTIRKLTRIERLRNAGTINHDEAAACQWYADAAAIGYDTTGTTANYAEAGSRSKRHWDHLPKYAAQEEGRESFLWARKVLPEHLLPMFEAVVLGKETLSAAAQGLFDDLAKSQRSSRIAREFRHVAAELHKRVCHLLSAE